MAHNKDGWAVEDGQIDRDFTPRRTRSERSSDTHWADELTDVLVALRPDELARLPLSEHTLVAVLHAKTITAHGALRRQMRYVSKLLRAVEPEPIHAALNGASEGTDFEHLERWRDRILAQGDGAISTFLEKHPDGNRQQLRHVAGAARGDGDKAIKARKHLFQLLREAAGI